MQKTLTYIDINTRAQVYADGAFVTKSSDYINIERGQWQILCIQFGERQTDEAGAVTFTPVSFDTDTSFVFVADDNFKDDDSLMAKSLQSVIPFDEADPTSNMFNIEGDWIDNGTADYAKGQLSIRINSDTVKFAEVTKDKVSINSGVYINVKQYMQGLSNPSTIAWIPFIAKNTIRDWSSAQVIPPSGTEAISFINAYFRNPLERQWSEDNVTWFDSQSEEHDNYYRERISNIGADWSSGYKVARGFTYTPSVDSTGVLSWENNGGLPNPEPVNIKGEKGDPGNNGSDGAQGDMGLTGPSNSLSIGTVTSGGSASATITGTAPNQVLNLVLPQGPAGDAGAIISNVKEYSFSISSSGTTSVTFTKTMLNGVAGEPEFDVIDSTGTNITNKDLLTRQWTNQTYVITYSGGWPVGTYKLKPHGAMAETYIPNPKGAYLDGDGCVSLEESNPEFTLFDPVRNVTGIRLWYRSANASVTGNAVIVQIVDGDEVSRTVINVAAHEQNTILNHSWKLNGYLTLKRDMLSSDDTLSGVGFVISNMGLIINNG